MVPRDLVFADRAPWIFDFDGLVTATPAEVWAAFVDNESWTIWFANCKSCRATSEPFSAVGVPSGVGLSRRSQFDSSTAAAPHQGRSPTSGATVLGRRRRTGCYRS